MDYFIVRHLRNGILAHTEDQYSVMSVEEIMADKTSSLHQGHTKQNLRPLQPWHH